ncbi:MAG: FAD binding domain-containing protein [Spirochaetales bacterium]|nr:FAD binding domain-containing protein [Spirochaetales bacterium]
MYPVLEKGVKTIGSLQVRNRGTIGGNICTAAPSADGIGPLLVLNTICEVSGITGSRQVPLENFFTGPKQTVLEDDEILTSILIPPVPYKYGGAYFKYGRRNAMEIALLGISVYLVVAEDNKTCTDIRIALTTSAPTPIRVGKTENFLKGKDLTNYDNLSEAGKVVLTEAKPRSSWRSSAEFRYELLEKLVPRTIKTAFSRAVDEGNK